MTLQEDLEAFDAASRELGHLLLKALAEDVERLRRFAARVTAALRRRP